MDLLQRNNVNVLDWPARLPDLSPIEHMWDMLGRRVNKRHDLNSLADLERALHQKWRRIPVYDVNKLINSLRSDAVMAAGGGHARY